MNKYHTPIKYDTKKRKGYIIWLIIFGSVIFLFFIFLLLETYIISNSLGGFFDILFAFLTTSLYVAVFGTLISILKLIDSSMYLKRLKNNTFLVPEDKTKYDNSLLDLPREKEIENNYASDSKLGGLISLIIFLMFISIDLSLFIKWNSLDDGSLFILLMIIHIFFLVYGIIVYSQRNTEKYIDEVDIKDGRKVRISLNKAIITLIITGIVAAMGIMLANNMTKYIYKSRNGHYDKTTEEFKEKATMTITSKDLTDGVWNDQITNTDKGDNLSPELSFEKVDGADYYFIYMVDETANNWVHWLATDVREEDLSTGANKAEYKDDPDFSYVGPYPPVGSGDHTYTIYVYAMKGKPDSKLELEFDKSFFSGDYLYYDYLNISESGNPNVYGNVISYGYISGTYSR